MPAIRAFRRKQAASLRNGWRIFREQHIFKVTFIFGFALMCEFGLWVLFRDGFRYLQSIGGIAGIITARLFSLFFLGMGLMLVMSAVITSYSTLYRSQEVPFLLVRPLPTSQIVLYKFAESTYFSTWAFVFIIVPFVGAYAAHERLSPLFAIWTVLFSAPFLVVCSGIGTAVIVAAVRWYPRRFGLKPVVALFAGLIVWAAVRIAGEAASVEDAQFTLSTLVPGLRLASNPLLPSTWMAEGILAMSRAQWLRGAMLLASLTASALVVSAVVEWAGSRTFRAAWEQLETGGGRRARSSAVFRRLDAALRFLTGDLRAMIMKDVRTFFRDPMQWSQGLIFFGLLGMYFANLRSFHYDTYGAQWRNMVSFLNIFSVSAVLCSLGARFIYPQLSLEGQGFWLLGLSPTSMRRVVLAKLALAGFVTVTVSLLLIALSTAMLRMDAIVRNVSLLLIASVALAVTCLSTGLGALFLDLRQRNPAAIVGGFGGTVNLVVSLTFMLATIIPFGLVFHMRVGGIVGETTFARGLGYCLAWLAALTALAVFVPVALGIRALNRRDY